MSVSVETSVRIRRPPADVFAFIADPTNLPRWDPAIREVRRTEDGPVGRGSGLLVTAEEGGRRVAIDTTIVEFEPDRAFGIEATYGGVPITLTWRLEPIADGTRLTARGEAEVGGLLALAGGFIKGIVLERLDDAHASLKRLLEA